MPRRRSVSGRFSEMEAERNESLFGAHSSVYLRKVGSVQSSEGKLRWIYGCLTRSDVRSPPTAAQIVLLGDAANGSELASLRAVVRPASEPVKEHLVSGKQHDHSAIGVAEIVELESIHIQWSLPSRIGKVRS